MTDHDAILAAIKGRPDDDNPRLVYADWLDDRVDPGAEARAAFIRCQMELARVRPRPIEATTLGSRTIGVEPASEVVTVPFDAAKGVHAGMWIRVTHRFYDGSRVDFDAVVTIARLRGDSRRGDVELSVTAGRHPRADREAELMREERSLWSANVDAWAVELPGGPKVAPRFSEPPDRRRDPTEIDYLFARGFVESVTCPAADWLAHADAILAAHPVRRVRLTTDVILDCYADAGLWARLPGRHKKVSQTTPRPEFGSRSHREAVAELLELEWPGITFELPPAGLVEWNRDEVMAAVSEVQRADGLVVAEHGSGAVTARNPTGGRATLEFGGGTVTLGPGETFHFDPRR